MSRPVAIRVSFRNDVGFFLRFEGSIAKDERFAQAWRDETVALIRTLTMRLLEAEASMGAGSNEKRGRKSSGQSPASSKTAVP